MLYSDFMVNGWSRESFTHLVKKAMCDADKELNEEKR